MNHINSFLPLTEPTLYILLSLAPGPKHGYAIMKEVQILSRQRVMLSTGTLYGALKRLLEQGWIERPAETIKPPSRGSQAYQLTSLGSQILTSEIERLQALLTTAHTQILKA